jgi:hypothetical protein
MGWGISPHPSNDSTLIFFGKLFSGFENLITKCDFNAFRSIIKHSKVPKSHQGIIATF